jgi:hypothetical protein
MSTEHDPGRYPNWLLRFSDLNTVVENVATCHRASERQASGNHEHR